MAYGLFAFGAVSEETTDPMLMFCYPTSDMLLEEETAGASTLAKGALSLTWNVKEHEMCFLCLCESPTDDEDYP